MSPGANAAYSLRMGKQILFQEVECGVKGYTTRITTNNDKLVFVEGDIKQSNWSYIKHCTAIDVVF